MDASPLFKGSLMLKSLSLAAVSVLALGAAEAAVVDITGTTQAGTFQSFGTPGAPGVQGAELRGGRDGNRDWEIGVGAQTSVGGQFLQGQLDWQATGQGVAETFTFSIDASGVATLIIGQGGSEVFNKTWNASPLSLGNAIEFFTKRQATVSITSVNGQAVNFTSGDISDDASESLILFSEDFLNGLTVSGLVDMVGGGGSRNSLLIKAGNVDSAPVPVPAAAALFLGGLGLLARRKKQA